MREGAFQGYAAGEYALEADRNVVDLRRNLRERPAAASTPAEVVDQVDKSKLEAWEASQFWRKALTDPVGQREILKLLHLTQAFEKSPFAADMSGRLQDRLSDHKLGQMSIGHALYQWLAIVARAELFALQDHFNIHGELAVRPHRQD